MPRPATERFVSVDVETSGPNPAVYSLLAIGACLVDQPTRTFYVELSPTSSAADPEAMRVHGLSLERLARQGLQASEAMQRFDGWLSEVVPQGHAPTFVGFNAAFDWMFVCDYFHRSLGRNPFGHAALDLKSYAMGLHGGAWIDTTKEALAKRYPGRPLPSHNALQDALEQAELFRQMLAAQAARKT